MRAAFVFGSILSSCACLFFFACTDDDPAGPGGDAGAQEDGQGGSSGFSSGGLPDGGSSGAVDSGARVPKNGCLLFATPMASGKKAENVAKAGAVNWTNVEGATKEDDKVATVVLEDGQESAELRISDFGLDVPATAETWGMIVELKRRTLTDGGVLQTSNVDVDIAGKETTFKFDSASFFWPRTIVGTHPYGQEVDTWGIDLQPGDVTTPQFAATLRVKKATDGGAPGPITGTVDALRVQVWYATGNEKTCKR